MINKWILNNFKSINQQKELHFRPLTIFTGANSSGKSTILQSILLVTQTLQDQIESRSIVLNGWFKKFGTYSDIVFHREDENWEGYRCGMQMRFKRKQASGSSTWRLLV